MRKVRKLGKFKFETETRVMASQERKKKGISGKTMSHLGGRGGEIKGSFPRGCTRSKKKDRFRQRRR
jgi:hypothetical protein